MKIKLTVEQFETLRAALQTARIALETVEKNLRESGCNSMADYRANQLREVTNALETTQWTKIQAAQD
jgi:hypothetical protein